VTVSCFQLFALLSLLKFLTYHFSFVLSFRTVSTRNLELLLDVTYQEPGEISLVVSSAGCSTVLVLRQGNVSPSAEPTESGSVSSTSPTFLTRLADLRSDSVSPGPSCISGACGGTPDDPISAGDDPSAGMSR
jgi:hypothetical protein